MNQSKTLQKLVSLLGDSENDPKLQALFIELGEKFPLKRPKSDETGYLLEDNKKKNRGFHLGFRYADTLPLIKNDEIFKEGEMVFDAIQGIDIEKYEEVIFPFGLTWWMSLGEVIKLLGSNYYKSEARNFYVWRKDDIIIRLEFDEEQDLYDIIYRLVWDVDLEKFGY